MPKLHALSLACSVLLLAGCGATLTPPSTTAGAMIAGVVHGGQQPIIGARVYLFAAGTGGYGTASTSLLTVGLAGTDSVGGYILTGPGGSFALTGDYTCTAGQQVYMLALGGDPTGGTTYNNTAISLMAALGNCPGGTLALRLPHVVINEATTVAAAYALAGFATDPTHIASSGTTQAATGVANAMLTAASLVDPTSGLPRTTTPSGGAAPIQPLNTLSNILAACINTTANNSVPCNTLFVLERNTNGQPPTDTASAAINMAHQPGVNTAALFTLPNGTGSPFQPALTSAPNDFSLSIVYPFSSNQIAFDSAGNLFTSYPGVMEYSNTGALLSPVNGFTGGGIDGNNSIAAGVALDPSNNAWVISENGGTSNNFLTEFISPGKTGAAVAQYSGGGLNQPSTLVIDGAGNVFVGNSTGGTISKFANIGTPLTPLSAAGQASINGLAVDNRGNLWADSFAPVSQASYAYSLTEISNTGTLIARPVFASSSDYQNLSLDASNDVWGTLYPGSGTNQIFKLAPTTGAPVSNFPATGNTALQQCLQTQIDGAGNLWCASDADSIAELSSAGYSLSPDAGYIAPGIYGPEFIAIDNSGNVWTGGDYSYNNNIFNTYTVELVGAAAPVVTPMSLAIQLGKVGARP